MKKSIVIMLAGIMMVGVMVYNTNASSQQSSMVLAVTATPVISVTTTIKTTKQLCKGRYTKKCCDEKIANRPLIKRFYKNLQKGLLKIKDRVKSRPFFRNLRKKLTKEIH